MKAGLLANSTDSTAPVLAHDFILTPDLVLVLVFDVVGLNLGGRSRATRCSGYGMMATHTAARVSRGSGARGRRDRVLVVRHRWGIGGQGRR